MTVYFAANEFEAFTITAAGSWAFDTTAGPYDATIARGAMKNNNAPGSTLTGNLVTPSASFWISFDWYGSSGTNSTNPGVLVVLNDGTKNFLRVVNNSSGLTFTWNFQLQKSSNGSTWVNVGSGSVVANNSRVRLALQVVLNAAGTFAFYNGSTLIASSNEDTTVYATTCTNFTLSITNTSGGAWACWFSSVIVSDVDNRSWKLKTIYPSAAGSNSAWTGLFSDINASAVPTDTTPNTAATAALKQSYAVTDVGANQYSAYSIAAVVTSTRAQVGASAPLHIDHLIRRGSTDYLSTDKAPATSFGPVEVVWPTDPSTGAAWNLASFTGALEYGYNSAT